MCALGAGRVEIAGLIACIVGMIPRRVGTMHDLDWTQLAILEAIMTLKSHEEGTSAPFRTSPIGLESHIAGRTLVSGGSAAWTDMFVQLLSRLKAQQPFPVPAMAEPLFV